jgi:hypothetical protein
MPCFCPAGCTRSETTYIRLDSTQIRALVQRSPPRRTSSICIGLFPRHAGWLKSGFPVFRVFQHMRPVQSISDPAATAFLQYQRPSCAVMMAHARMPGMHCLCNEGFADKGSLRDFCKVSNKNVENFYIFNWKQNDLVNHILLFLNFM